MWWLLLIIIMFLIARSQKGTLVGLVLLLMTLFFVVKFLVFLHYSVGAVGVIGSLLVFGTVLLHVHYRDKKLNDDLNDSLKRYEAFVRERNRH